MSLGHEFDEDVGVLSVELEKLFCQIKGGDTFHCGDADFAGQFARLRSDRLDDGHSKRFHPLGDRQEAMAVFGQDETVGLSLEKLDREILFQFRDAAADRGVIDVQPTRCRHQPALTRKFEKEDKVIPIEHLPAHIRLDLRLHNDACSRCTKLAQSSRHFEFLQPAVQVLDLGRG